MQKEDTDTTGQADVIRKRFVERYHQEPLLVRSPGRINLIGEHTDYNEGYVMPAAIDRELIFAIGFSNEPHGTLHALKQHESINFDVTNPIKLSTPQWPNYMLGVVRQFIDKGFTVRPFNCIVGGDVPTGAGLSSSAALECGFAFAVNHLHGFLLPKLELVHMAQWAEHHYVGVKCGIMDQFASMMGAEGNAFVLDCRDLSYHYFPLHLKDFSIVLCDTMVKHSLSDSAYNTRRTECESGVSLLQKYYPDIKSLRDVTIGMIEDHRQEFVGKIYDRCTYVVQENQRVLDAANDLKKGDLNAFGKKMYASHDGLTRLYEVSCDELDFLVEESKKNDSVIGSRMMGGGFGGCTINIVSKSGVDSFLSAVKDRFRNRFGHDMNSYVMQVKNGTSIIETDSKD
jgi:galactokinase